MKCINILLSAVLLSVMSPLNTKLKHSIQLGVAKNCRDKCFPGFEPQPINFLAKARARYEEKMSDLDFFWPDPGPDSDPDSFPESDGSICGQCCKTFYGRKLRLFTIS